jgi:hypothetical protein
MVGIAVQSAASLLLAMHGNPSLAKMCPVKMTTRVIRYEHAQPRTPMPFLSAHHDRSLSMTTGSSYAAGTGNAVTDLIFSIAKRDVTFFSGTAPISFL